AQRLQRLDEGDDIGPALRAFERAKEIERLLEEGFDQRGVGLDPYQLGDAAKLRGEGIGGADAGADVAHHRRGVFVDGEIEGRELGKVATARTVDANQLARVALDGGGAHCAHVARLARLFGALPLGYP